MTFEQDLQKGDNGEQAIAKLLLDKGMKDVVITSGNTPEYDISAVSSNGNTVTYEVKTDFYYETGNMAIELFCMRRLKPTGILASNADWFVYIYDQSMKAYFIKKDDLLNVIKSPEKGWVVNGGDNNQAVIIKFPRHRLPSDKTTIIDISQYYK